MAFGKAKVAILASASGLGSGWTKLGEVRDLLIQASTPISKELLQEINDGLQYQKTIQFPVAFSEMDVKPGPTPDTVLIAGIECKVITVDSIAQATEYLEPPRVVEVEVPKSIAKSYHQKQRELPKFLRGKRK